jgi:hypothetical protein
VERKTSSRRPALLALVAVGAAAVAAGLVSRRGPTHPVLTVSDAAPNAAGSHPPPVPALPLPPPHKVHLSISSDPAGARVLDADGEVRGRTPLELDIPAAPRPLQLRLEKTGYKPARVSLEGDQDGSVDVELVRPAPPPPRPHPHVRPPPPVDEPAKL